MVKSNKSKRSIWKSVDVSLPDPGAASKNHYDQVDSTKVKASAKKDLEALSSESVGMFFGLEVLDGSMYEVNDNRMTIKYDEIEAKDKKEEKQKKEQEEKKAAPPVVVDAVAKKTKAQKRKELKLKRRKAKGDAGNRKDVGDTDSPSLPDAKGPAHEEAADDEEKPSKKRKKNSSSKKEEKDTQPPNKKSTADDIAMEETNDVVKKKKPKKKKNKQPEPSEEEPIETPDDTPVDPKAITALQTSWMFATGGVTLHEDVCKGLLRQDFQCPTPIQAATLPAAILGRRNIVGAAATGSGKTLAYVLPILQYYLELTKDDDDQFQRPLQALILAPTRELALQVAHECEKLMPRVTGTIVGGLAPHKQVRILEKRKPPIVIGTPGRLWQLMSSRLYEHLNDLTQLRYLVIDEADRMIQQGSFPQMERILDSVHSANPLDGDDDSDDEESDGEEPTRMLSLPGIPGEARVLMLDDIMQQMRERNGEEPPEPVELDDSDFEEEADDMDEDDESEIELPSAPPVYRQTFVFSATLTLPPSDSYRKKKRANNKSKDQKETLSGAIAEILEKAHAFGQTKVVDLTTSNKLTLRENGTINAKAGAVNIKSRLPPGLTLRSIACTQKHKDSHLYAYLVTTAQGAKGPCLIFCNSIAAVKRVGTTLLTLKLPVRMLHASMPQKARFKAVESLRSGARAIVVSTDVAARGLDIPNVATVVHYDVARAVDTFIHRAGRTARGMGEKAIGSSVSLIAPAEDKQFKAILDELGKNTFEPVQLDGRLLAEAQERVNMASKIVACDDVESRSKSNNKWFIEAAAETGLELDDSMLDKGLAGGDLKDQQRLREATKARSLLRQLLATPMKTQRFGKFLSCSSAVARQEVEGHVVPLEMSKKRKKGKRV